MLKTPVAIILIALLSMIACSSTAPLVRKNVGSIKGIDDTFTLHIMQDEGGYDASRAAVVDLEGDKINLVPFVSRYNLKTYKGISLAHAIELSNSVFSESCGYSGRSMKALIMPSGHRPGFEIIPSYGPYACEFTPTVYLDYFDKAEGNISVVLKVIGKWERSLKAIPKTP